eukprot:COSAG02_NODE_6716_length_3403_cov_2.549334_3_plen_60_part_00
MACIECNLVDCCVYTLALLPVTALWQTALLTQPQLRIPSPCREAAVGDGRSTEDFNRTA